MEQSDSRKQKILDILKAEKIVYVSSLSEKFGVSQVTVRKNLQELEEEGLIQRTHGGATLRRVERVSIEPFFEELCIQNVEEKRAIAKLAYEQIADGDAILLDASTTVLELCHLIRDGERKNLTVITNALKVSMELAACPEVSLIQVGGSIRSSLFSASGPMTTQALKNLHADKAFIGLNGIDTRYGLTTQNMLECEIKRCMVDISTTSYVLADHSKFGNVALSVIAPVNSVFCIITDSEVPAARLMEIQERGVRVMLAKV